MTYYADQIINADSFQPGEEVRSPPHKMYPDGLILWNGTVEVTLFGKTKRVRAMRYDDGRIRAGGISGRYPTGAKSWPASVMLEPGRGTYVHFGRDYRSGKFHKSSGLFFTE